MWVGPDAAPAGVPRKHALGRRRGSTRWPLRAARQELADGWSSTSRMTPAKRARPPEGETPRWRAERRPRSREGTRHDRTMVAPLGAPSPSISEGYGRRAYPGPRQKIRVMPFGLTCNRFATLREHLSIGPDRPSWRRDSAIPFNHIEARFAAGCASKDAGGPPGSVIRAGRQGPWTPRPV